jgi:hypothetical protein
MAGDFDSPFTIYHSRFYCLNGIPKAFKSARA